MEVKGAPEMKNLQHLILQKSNDIFRKRFFKKYSSPQVWE